MENVALNRMTVTVLTVWWNWNYNSTIQLIFEMSLSLVEKQEWVLLKWLVLK